MRVAFYRPAFSNKICLHKCPYGFLLLLYHYSSSHPSHLLFTTFLFPSFSYFSFPSLSILFFSSSLFSPFLFFQHIILFFPPLLFFLFSSSHLLFLILFILILFPLFLIFPFFFSTSFFSPFSCFYSSSQSFLFSQYRQYTCHLLVSLWSAADIEALMHYVKVYCTL